LGKTAVIAVVEPVGITTAIVTTAIVTAKSGVPGTVPTAVIPGIVPSVIPAVTIEPGIRPSAVIPGSVPTAVVPWIIPGVVSGAPSHTIVEVRVPSAVVIILVKIVIHIYDHLVRAGYFDA
jgi:hypothetical protein